MDAPLGITFFKKVEIYQKICDLDTNAIELDKDPDSGGTLPTWPAEKKILR